MRERERTRSAKNARLKNAEYLSSREIFVPRKIGLLLVIVGAILLPNTTPIMSNVAVTWNAIGIILLIVGGLSLIGEQ